MTTAVLETPRDVVAAGPALAALAAATAVGTIGMSAASAVNPLIAARLTGSDTYAGLPVTVLVTGSAAAALLISTLTPRMGRARGLMLGYVVGAAGAALAVGATVAQSLGWLLVACLLLGAANAAIFLTRYAAAALVGEAVRGRALGGVFVATALGAVVSTSALGPAAAASIGVGLPALSGAYVIAVLSFAGAAAILGALSWQRTRRLGRRAGLMGAGGVRVPAHELVRGLQAPSVRLALVVLALTNLVMVAVMVIAPIQMMADGDGLETVGIVISVHVAGMFGPSPLSGWLADKRGPITVAAVGGLLMATAAVAGGLVDTRSMGEMMAALAVLGVGWNFGIVGGSTLLAGSVPASLRPHFEGIGEVATSLAAAAGAPAAGLLAALAGFAGLSVAAAAGSIGGLALMARRRS